MSGVGGGQQIGPWRMSLSDFEVVRIGRDIAEALAEADATQPVMVGGNRVEVRQLAKDIPSLGVVLYTALAGEAPASAKPFARRRPDLPNELGNVIDRCLRAQFVTARDVALALEHVLPRLSRLAIIETRPEPAEKDEAPPPKRVLIADDDPAMRRLFETLSRRAGVDCDVAANGPEAISSLKLRAYDLMFLDIMMPRIDGWGVLDYLRSRATLHRPSIFIITAFIDQMLSAADREIVHGILYKPFDTDEVATLMRDAARGGRITTALHNTRHRLFEEAS